jgi:GDPmannose 4,6-dehydratase
MKKALITGITGQDGSYLAEFLLNKGYEVFGIVRRTSTFQRERVEHLNADDHSRGQKIRLLYGDVTDSSNVYGIISDVMPDEIYNLAAQSHVQISFETAEYTANADALGALRILEVIRKINLKDKIKYYQASTSELYGATATNMQNEKTPFNPQSPYAVAKLYAYWITSNYRDAYGLFGCNGILFNHESPRRAENFVSRKITYALANIKSGKYNRLYIGNLDAKRDWGYAPEYVEAMWKMLQLDKPTDMVIATGETHTVREFIEEAAKNCDMQMVWKGSGPDEVGIDVKSGKTIVKVDKNYFRPLEVNYLCGDCSRANKLIGWEPKVKFKELVKIMMKHDLSLAGIK